MRGEDIIYIYVGVGMRVIYFVESDKSIAVSKQSTTTALSGVHGWFVCVQAELSCTMPPPPPCTLSHYLCWLTGDEKNADSIRR